MRFLIVLLSLYGSVSFATVNDFNGLIAETTQQERRLHKKLLQSIQNVQVSIAYNDQDQKLRDREQAGGVSPQVRLTPAEDRVSN